MGINKGYACTAFLLIATLTNAAPWRNWKHGRLISMDTTTTSGTSERRYECVVSDGTFSYTMEYEHPIKAPVHRPVKFMIESIQDTLILLDADGKERPAHIEKRERVFFDPPGPRLLKSR
jgi:isocitrate dehydrogenase